MGMTGTDRTLSLVPCSGQGTLLLWDNVLHASRVLGSSDSLDGTIISRNTEDKILEGNPPNGESRKL